MPMWLNINNYMIKQKIINNLILKKGLTFMAKNKKGLHRRLKKTKKKTNKQTKKGMGIVWKSNMDQQFQMTCWVDTFASWRTREFN